jgi:hypothetical protein
VFLRNFKLVEFVKLELKNFKNDFFLGEFQLPEVGRKSSDRYTYLAPISNQKYRRKIKILCFISGNLQPDLAKSS